MSRLITVVLAAGLFSTPAFGAKPGSVTINLEARGCEIRIERQRGPDASPPHHLEAHLVDKADLSALS